MKSLLVFVTVIIMSAGLSSAGRTECTKNGGCISYDNNGNGLRCGPDGCGPVGGSAVRHSAVRQNNGQSRSGGAVACGIDGCKGFQDQGYGYGCGPQGCGPLGSNYQPVVGSSRYYR